MRKSSHSSSKYGIQNLDFLGDKFKIGYSTLTGKFQTKLGGYLTILMGILSISMFFVVMSQFFKKDAPVVMTSTEFGSKVVSFNLYENNLYLPLGWMSQGKVSRAENITRFVTIMAIVNSVTFHPQSESGFEVTPYRVFEYVPCSQIEDPKMKDFVQEVVSLPGTDKFMACPDFKGMQDDFVVSDNYQNYTFKWASIKVYPCSLEDKSNCASAEEIKTLNAQYGHPLKLLQTSDYDNPVRSAPPRRSINVDPRTTKVIKEVIRRNRILDDTMSMVAPTLKAEYASMTEESIDYKKRTEAQIYCSKAQIMKGPAGGCQEYLTYDYVPSGEIIVTRRSYKSITMMLGEFGGILKIITTVVFFLYGVYSLRKVKSILGGIIFNTDDQKLKKLIEKKDPLSKSPETVVRVQKQEDENTETHSSVSRPKYNEIVEELIKDRSNVDSFMQKLNFIDLIEKAVFKDHERALLPVVLLKAKQKELKDQKQQKKRKNNKISPKIAKRKNPAILRDMTNSEPNDLTLENAYINLVESEPNNQLSKVIKDYMLGELNNTFKFTAPEIVATYKRLSQASSYHQSIDTSQASGSRIMLTAHQQGNKSNKSSPNSPNSSFSSRRGSLQAHLRRRGSAKRIKLSKSTNKKVYMKSKFNNNLDEQLKQKKLKKASYSKIGPID